MKTQKKLLMIALAMSMVLLPALASRAVAAMVDFGPATLNISQLGDLTLVVKEGVPQTIVVRGRNLDGNGHRLRHQRGALHGQGACDATT